jgi:chlorite dismutase
MSNLKILGAQRVKALTEMLKEQEASAVAEIRREQLKREDAEVLVNVELGIGEYIAEIEAIKARVNELSELVRVKTGVYYTVSKNSHYTPEKVQYDKAVNKAQIGDTNEKIAKVQSEFKRKEQQLWLCETLEEAKAIVGIQ